MHQNQDLQARFTFARETCKPEFEDSGANFAAFSSEWLLRTECNRVTSCYQIFLSKVYEKCLEKPFRVTTFIETQANCGLPLLPSITTVEIDHLKVMLWSCSGAQISDCFPQFHSGYPFKIVCLCYDFPSAPQNVKETVQVPPMIRFGPRSSSRHNVSNLPHYSTSLDKSVQVCLEFSPDLESLSMDFSKMLENKYIPYVQVRCGNHTFPAHRAVLAARSEVFADMFRNKIVDSESGIVDIDDLDAPILELVLKYLYSGKIPSASDDAVLKLYAAAEKYALLALKKVYSEWMVGSLTEENCLDFLAFADTHSDKDLKDTAVNFILRHMWILKSRAWSSFKEKYPKLAISLYDIIVTQKCFSV